MKRRDRKRRPGRRPPTRVVRKRILVLCEGEVTEPQYFRQFKQWKRNPLVEVVIPADHGVPRTLVEVAKEKKNDADSLAKKERDDNWRFDEVWCVFDVDEHPNLHEALVMARDNGIHVAVSNECFELWLLLHFTSSPGPQGRKELAKRLKKQVPDYDKKVDIGYFKAGYEEAVARAKKLDEQANEDEEPYRNPTTGVYRLTETIASA